MALDPNTGAELDPYVAWAMAQQQQGGEQQFDASTPLVGTIFDIPKTMIPPAPQMPTQAPGPRTVHGIPIPEEYDEPAENGGEGMPNPVKDHDRGRWVDPNSGDTIFPYGNKPTPTPRDDAARFSQGGPNQAEEVAQAGRLTPEEEAQIEIDPYVAAYQQSPLEADAISGADPQAGVSDIVGDITYEQYAATPETPSGYLEHQTELANGLPLPSMRENAIGEATRTAVNAMSPEEYLQYKSDREGKLIAEQARLQHEAELTNERRAREDLEDHRAATAKANADTRDMLAQATALANTKIDPERYKNNRGIGGTFRDVASVFLSGLAGNADGALKTIDQRIERDIAAQSADIANGWQGVAAKKGAIHDELTRHGDLYRAQETYRIASYQGAINDLQSQLQQYDPAGATAIRGRDSLEQLQSAQAKAIASYNQQAFKNGLDLAKEKREGALAMSTIAKNNAEIAKMRLAAGAGAKVKPIKPDDVVQSAEYFERAYGKRPPHDMSQNSYETWAKTGKVVEEYSKVQRENSPEERNRELGAGEIVYDDGTPVQFRDAGWGGKFGSSKAAADNAVRLIDKIIARRKKNGWESDWVSGGNKREMDADFAALQLEKKNTDELGVLAGPDLGLINKSVGTSDPNEWRDSLLPGLRAARSNIIEQVNAKLRGQIVVPQGKRLKRWDPPAQDYPETAALVRGKTSVEQGEGAKRGKAGEAIQTAFYGVDNDEAAAKAEAAAKVGPTGLDIDDDKRVAAAIAEAKAGTPGAASALQRLVDAASGGRESVRAGVLIRIQGESPELYEQVIARLPKEVLADLPAKPDKGLAIGSPKFQFDSLDVGELARAVGADEGLRNVVIQRATTGKPAEKAKALQILERAMGGGK